MSENACNWILQDRTQSVHPSAELHGIQWYVYLLYFIVHVAYCSEPERAP